MKLSDLNYKNISARWLLLAFVVLSFILYGNTIKGDFVYDDNLFASRPELSDPAHLLQIWNEPYQPQHIAGSPYRPLTTFSFALNFILFGDSPVSFHVVDIILNGLAVFLVYLVALRLFKNKRLALFTALIFAFFPIHTEVVANIKSRDEILSTIFKLSAWLVFIRATDNITKKVNYRQVFLSSVVFIMAVLSKDLIFAAPIVFLAAYRFTRDAPWRAVIRSGLCYLPVMALYLLQRSLVLGQYAWGSVDTYFIQDPLQFEPWLVRIMTAFKMAYLYVQKILLPYDLSATYHYNQVPAVTNLFYSWQAILGLVILAAFLGLICWKKTRSGPLGIGAWLFFLPTYLVISQLFIVAADNMAERWMYLPSFGIALMMAYGLDKLYAYNKNWAIAALSIIILLYAAILIPRNNVWLSQEALYRSMVHDAPQSVQGQTNMARILIEKGKVKEALPYIATANSIYPDHPPLLELNAIVYAYAGNYPLADKYISRAVQAKSNTTNSYVVMSFIKAREGMYQQSLDIINQDLPPDQLGNPIVRFVLAVDYYRLGMIDEARKYFDWNQSMSEAEKIQTLKEF